MKYRIARVIVASVLIAVALTAQASGQVTMEHVRQFVLKQDYQVLSFQEHLVYNSLYPEDAERVLPISTTACDNPEGKPADMLLIRTYMQIKDSVLYTFVPYTGSGYENPCTLDGTRLGSTPAALAPDSYSALRVTERLKAYSDTLNYYHTLERRIASDHSVEGTVVGALVFGVGMKYLLDEDSGDDATTENVFAGIVVLGGGYLGYSSIRGIIATKKERTERARLEVKLSVGF